MAIIVGQARVRFRRGVEMWTHSKIWDTSNFLSVFSALPSGDLNYWL